MPSIHTCINNIHICNNSESFFTREVVSRSYSLLLPWAEFEAGAMSIISSTFKVAGALVKTTIIALCILTDSKILEFEIVMYMYDTLPNILDVIKSACKTMICFINIFLSTGLNGLCPSANVELHSSLGLVEIEQISSQAIKKGKNDVQGIKQGLNKVVGMHEIKEILRKDVLDAIAKESLYKLYKLSIPNGLLLYGPPGCGKTYIAKCFAEEAGWHFEEISIAKQGEKYVHQTSKNIREVFDKARKKAPSIVLIDEIDAIAPNRSNADIREYKIEELSTLLTELNNCSDSKVFIIAATNKVENIDEAILRTGRFDKKICVALPDAKTRGEILQFYMDERPKSDSINYEVLASETDKMSVSDLEYITNEAARKAVHQSEVNSLCLIDHHMLSQAIKELKKEQAQRMGGMQIVPPYYS